MKKSEIKVGGYYKAKVSNNLVTVRVDVIREPNQFWPTKVYYEVTNLTTGRKTTFRSAAKFRSETEKNPILKQFGTPRTVADVNCDQAQEMEPALGPIKVDGKTMSDEERLMVLETRIKNGGAY